MAIEGTLVDIADALCLAFETDVATNEMSRFTPIWPKGVTPVNNDGDRGVDIPDHGVVTTGQTIPAGGEFWDAGDERTSELSMPAECIREDGYVVFNANLVAHGPER